jgi:hypothetical protein
MKTSHYLVLTCIIAVFSACKGQNKETEPMEQTHLFTNELIHETSPYLLQHAHNPVIGILGEKAFQKPKKIGNYKYWLCRLSLVSCDKALCGCYNI